MLDAMKVLPTIHIIGLLMHVCTGSSASGEVYRAIVNITYKDPSTQKVKTIHSEDGRFGRSSRVGNEEGIIVHVRNADGGHHACSPVLNAVPSERWIALVERGACKFSEKIRNVAHKKNASAVVIYNHEAEDELVTMEHDVDDIISIFISKKDGQRIARLVDNGTRVYMQITVGEIEPGSHQGSGNLNHTSVLFVSISFIVLMIISLAWLVFYYIQRFRYAHAKERLSRRLMHAAKKAINKMPMKTLKSEDKEVESGYDQCAVCIEDYKANEVIRILPCKHIFHKSCVDPWLIEHRSCPMCKLDILKAYGLQIHNSEASLVNLDLERGSTSVGASELLHALDSGLSPDETDGNDHHVQMVCFHGLSAPQGLGTASAHYDACIETDSSSSEGHAVATCVAPDIHSTQNESSDFDKQEERRALLSDCACSPKHVCTPKPSSEAGPAPTASCTCGYTPSSDITNNEQHINESDKEALFGAYKCTCGKVKTKSVPGCESVSVHSGSSQSLASFKLSGKATDGSLSNQCTESLGSFMLDRAKDENQSFASITSIHSTHSLCDSAKDSEA